MIEIGPGTGSFADSMLDFFKNYDLSLYRNTEYIFVEISPQLASLCEQTIKKNHKALYDRGNIKIFNGSIFDWDLHVDKHTFVVGLEILDNMPHDRLFTNSEKSNSSEDSFELQSMVQVETD